MFKYSDFIYMEVSPTGSVYSDTGEKKQSKSPLMNGGGGSMGSGEDMSGSTEDTSSGTTSSEEYTSGQIIESVDVRKLTSTETRNNLLSVLDIGLGVLCGYLIFSHFLDMFIHRGVDKE